jgi:phosphohistidine phosphatase
MNLFLLRHGLAVERSIPSFKLDSDRPLTPEGRKKTRRMAEALARLGISFDLVLTSPYVRARQTAEIVAEVLGGHKTVETSKNLARGHNLKQLLQELTHLRRRRDNLLLVGHQPELGQLISVLVTGKAGLALEVKKGGLCKLEITRLHYGRCATLQWLLPAKLFSKLR